MRRTLCTTALIFSLLFSLPAFAADDNTSWFESLWDSVVASIADWIDSAGDPVSTQEDLGPDDNCAELGPGVTPDGCT